MQKIDSVYPFSLRTTARIVRFDQVRMLSVHEQITAEKRYEVQRESIERSN